jgi:two-component system, OmpR family, response regulator MprA
MERRPRRVLVAEDDYPRLLLHRTWLEAEGYEVWSAIDGVRALVTIADQGLPDAAVLDVEMPRLDGLDVCRFLRLQSDSLPIVFVSGREDVRDDAFAAGATDVLAKSADPKRLLRALRKVAVATAA